MRQAIIVLSLLLALAAAGQEQKVNVKVVPEDAIVIINGKIIRLDKGKAVVSLPAEIEYNYSVAKDGYEGVDGSFRLKSKSPFNLNVELNSEDGGAEDDAAGVAVADVAGYLKSQWDADNYNNMLRVIEKYPDNADCLYYHGCLCYYGLGVAKDREKAVGLFRQSADKGVADAFNRLGLAAASGWLTQGTVNGKARELAAEYYAKGAELGSYIAKYNLAELYRHGDIKRNDKEALRLYKEAADAGYANAMAQFGNCLYLNFDKDYARGMSKKEREAEALAWIRKAAEKGSAIGCYFLGKAYYYGHMGLSSNTMEAYEWFKKGADKGDSDCSFFIREHYKL